MSEDAPSGIIGSDELSMILNGTKHITSIMILIEYYQNVGPGRQSPQMRLILAAPRHGLMISMEMIQITTEEISFLTG